MTRSSNILFVLLLAACFTLPWLVNRQMSASLQANEAELRSQREQLKKLRPPPDSAARGKSEPLLSGEDLNELLRLRNEAGQLQDALRQTNRLQDEIARLRRALVDSTNAIGRDEFATNLFQDVLPIRRQRVAQLNQWLDQHPEERTPEMQFLSEEQWLRKLDRPLVTDDDYEGFGSMLRSDAQTLFADKAYAALKQYAAANDGQFPSALADLTTYFNPPVPNLDSMLQRYAIVPAQNLIAPLSQASGQDGLVITQVAPVNKQWDGRNAIGLNGAWSLVASTGCWDAPRR